MSRLSIIVLSVAAVLILLGLISRPRLLLMPVVWFFAWWSWARVLWTLPIHVRDWLVADTLARQAQAIHLHAATAAAVWETNSEYRPIAKHILGAVIGPAFGVSLEPKVSSFGEAAVLAAAAVAEKGHKPMDSAGRR